MNEWIRSSSAEPEDASTVALRSSLSEAIKLILSVVFYLWRRRSLVVSRGRRGRRDVGEEEQPLNGVHELPERRRSGSFSNGSGEENGWTYPTRAKLLTLRPWVSVSLVVVAALMLVVSTYTVRLLSL